jgi:hypothetical protein
MYFISWYKKHFTQVNDNRICNQMVYEIIIISETKTDLLNTERYSITQNVFEAQQKVLQWKSIPK